MKTCAVIVTYADRGEFCLKVTEEAITQGLQKIIIVDNGSSDKSKEMLKSQVERYPGKIEVVSLDSNKGSAKGFAAGIQTFLQSDCDSIWLLDDDNVPCTGAYENLVSFWNNLSGTLKEERIALCSLRRDRSNFVAALQAEKKKSVLPSKNSFMGFHIKRVLSLLTQRISPDRAKNAPLKKFATIQASAYGGLWMHRNLCQKIGFPDAAYVLYMDDFDFTNRITSMGGQILLLSESRIDDIESSFYLPEKKEWLYHSLLDARSDTIAYYTCRNVIFFSRKYLLTNQVVYHINKIIYCLAISLMSLLRHKRERLKVIFTAIKDGEHGHMGENPTLTLNSRSSDNIHK